MLPLELLKSEHTRYVLATAHRYEQWQVQHDQRLTLADLAEIPADILFNLGFGNWDNNLMLLPLWSLGLINPGEQLVCINGILAKVGVDIIDIDTRGGCLAYGFVHPGLAANEDNKDAA